MTEPTTGDAVARTDEGEDRPDPGIAFIEFLAKHKGGALAREIGEAMTELGHRVDETGRKGSVTIVLGIETMKKISNALQVSDKVTTKLPEPKRDDAVYFHTDEGVGLARTPPDQYRFPADIVGDER